MRTRTIWAIGAWLIACATVPAYTARSWAGADIPSRQELATDDGHLDRQALIAAVLESNRNLAAVRSAVEAARARAEKVRTLPDLKAAYSFGPLSIFEDDERYGQLIQVGQDLPWPGTLQLRGDRAHAVAAAGTSDLESLRRQLALAASLGFDDYWYLERALAVNREHQGLTRSFQAVATARYAAGLAPQLAPLAAEVEFAHLQHFEVVLGTDRRELIARLNRLLHRPADSALPPPTVEGHDSDHEPVPRTLQLQRLALVARPELRAARDRIGASEIGVDLAHLEGKPGLRPMASYNSMWNADAHRWMVGLGLSLPVWRERIRAGVAEADAELAAERARMEALEDQIATDVEVAAERLSESHHVVSLFASRLLPAARDQVRAAESGFETGEVDFLALIEAERNLRNVALGLAAAQADVRRRNARLKQAVGLMPGEPWLSGDSTGAAAGQPLE